MAVFSFADEQAEKSIYTEKQVRGADSQGHPQTKELMGPDSLVMAGQFHISICGQIQFAVYALGSYSVSNLPVVVGLAGCEGQKAQNSNSLKKKFLSHKNQEESSPELIGQHLEIASN